MTPEELTDLERWLDRASRVLLIFAALGVMWAVLDTWSGLPIHARPADRVVMMEVGR